MALKSGELEHAFITDIVSALPDESRTEVLKIMTHNSILEMAVKKNDFKTFSGHLDSLDEPGRDLFIDDFLENGCNEHVKLTELYIDYETLKKNRQPGDSYKATAQKMGSDSRLGPLIDQIEPDLKASPPACSLDL